MQRLFEMRNKMVRRAALDFASTYFKNHSYDLGRLFTTESTQIIKQYVEMKQENSEFVGM